MSKLLMDDWVAATKPWECKGLLWNKGVLMEDMQEKGWKKIEFPWLFSESGAQISANWMWPNFYETSVPNTLLN